MEVSGQLHAQATFSPGKEPLLPIGRRQGGPQSRSGLSGEDNSVSAGTRTPDYPARSPALSVQVRGALKHFVTKILTVRDC
jgi:hypothetical protein